MRYGYYTTMIITFYRTAKAFATMIRFIGSFCKESLVHFDSTNGIWFECISDNRIAYISFASSNKIFETSQLGSHVISMDLRKFAYLLREITILTNVLILTVESEQVSVVTKNKQQEIETILCAQQSLEHVHLEVTSYETSCVCNLLSKTIDDVVKKKKDEKVLFYQRAKNIFCDDDVVGQRDVEMEWSQTFDRSLIQTMIKPVLAKYITFRFKKDSPLSIQYQANDMVLNIYVGECIT